MARCFGPQWLAKSLQFEGAPGQQPSVVLEQTWVRGESNTSWESPEPIDPPSMAGTGDDLWIVQSPEWAMTRNVLPD